MHRIAPLIAVFTAALFARQPKSLKEVPVYPGALRDDAVAVESNGVTDEFSHEGAFYSSTASLDERLLGSGAGDELANDQSAADQGAPKMSPVEARKSALRSSPPTAAELGVPPYPGAVLDFFLTGCRQRPDDLRFRPVFGHRLIFQMRR